MYCITCTKSIAQATIVANIRASVSLCLKKILVKKSLCLCAFVFKRTSCLRVFVFYNNRVKNKYTTFVIQFTFCIFTSPFSRVDNKNFSHND